MLSLRLLRPFVLCGLLLARTASATPCRSTLTPTSPTHFSMLGGTGTARISLSDPGCPMPTVQVSDYVPQFVSITSLPTSGGGEMTYRVEPNPFQNG
ncbi:MAG TPA: hypothetical protein VGM23_09625, partial [Armatimonadota bacterium]